MYQVSKNIHLIDTSVDIYISINETWIEKLRQSIGRVILRARWATESAFNYIKSLIIG